MTKPMINIARSIVRDIPLHKLVPSPDNVRKTMRAGVVEERAASILAHGLLQNLNVRPELNDEKRETGRYEVVAGRTRLAALKLLAERKQIAKNAPISCAVREDGSAAELSLAENIERDDLHPADQFEAFRHLQEKEGLGADDIAARFGVTPNTVRARLKLGSVSPALINVYREGGMTLEQLMAFTVTDDRTRQEDVWTNLPLQRSAERIRRALREGQVSATDKRAVFVGQAAYEAAGGAILRDLFAEDHGGYLTDPALLDRLARSKLEGAASAVQAEGWKWVELATDFPHHLCLRRIQPHDVPLAPEDIARLEEIESELDAVECAIEQGESDDPQAEAKGIALNAEYERLNAKASAFDPHDLAMGGAFVAIAHDGSLYITRGLVRREDEPKAQAHPDAAEADKAADGNTAPEEGEQQEGAEEEPSGYSDRLTADLTAQRTLAIRDALGANVELSIIALTHVLALQAFYYFGSTLSCLKVDARSISLEPFAPGIGDSIAARHIAARHDAWTARMPKEPGGLWLFVRSLEPEERLSLLAHCAALSVEDVATHGMSKGAYCHADALAGALALDMRDYWTPTVSSYLGRVSKALILEAVREGVSEEAAEPLAHLKKADMAQTAEQLLVPTTWLPLIWRTMPVPVVRASETDLPVSQAAE